MFVEVFAPRGTDHQTPHDQDEIYVVMSGSATLEVAGEPHELIPGDVAFVPAGVRHRFSIFTDDFAAWVVFYGPPGGEAGRVGPASLSEPSAPPRAIPPPPAAP